MNIRHVDVSLSFVSPAEVSVLSRALRAQVSRKVYAPNFFSLEWGRIVKDAARDQALGDIFRARWRWG